MGLRSISSSRSARLRIERNTVSVLMIVGSPTPSLRSLATQRRRPQLAELVIAPLRNDPEIELEPVVRASLVGEVDLRVVGPPHLACVMAQGDRVARQLVEQMEFAGRLEVLDLALEPLGGLQR